MSIHLTNAKQIQDLVRRRVRVDVKRTSAEIVNKCSAQILIGAKGVKGAVHLTPKATEAGIRRDLGRKYHAWTFEGKSHAVKLIYIMASKKLKKMGRRFISFDWWNMMVREESLKIWQARNSSRAFLAAGWLPAVRDLGYTKHRALGGHQRAGGRASRGGATRATPGNLTSVIFNAAVEKQGGGDDPRAYTIADQALQVAVALAIKDLEKYVVRKETEAVLRRYSDK